MCVRWNFDDASAGSWRWKSGNVSAVKCPTSGEAVKGNFSGGYSSRRVATTPPPIILESGSTSPSRVFPRIMCLRGSKKVVQPGVEPGTFCGPNMKCETEIITTRPLNLCVKSLDPSSVGQTFFRLEPSFWPVNRAFSLTVTSLIDVL